MSNTEQPGEVTSDMADAARSIRATHEDQKFNSESADVSDDELDQPDSRG